MDPERDNLEQAGPAAVLRPAVFFDRDGTLIHSVHYLADPNLVQLMPGVAHAVRALAEAGFACVVVTNQAAIGKGLLTEAGLAAIHRELDGQFAREGARIDAYYHCPLAGTSAERTVIDHPDRKPGPGMLLRAAREMGLDVARSWMVGDVVSDALAGHNAGCRRSILVGPEAAAEVKLLGDGVRCVHVRDVAEAAALILRESAGAAAAEPQRD